MVAIWTLKKTIQWTVYGLLPFSFESAKQFSKGRGSASFEIALGKSLANFFQKGGPLFQKIGQIMASRDDIFSKITRDEMSILFNKIPPMKAHEVQKILSQVKIKDIDPNPFSTGSVAQVHHGRLKNNKKIVIKIVRKNYEKQLKKDLIEIEKIIDKTKILLKKKKFESLKESFQELSQGMIQECDLENEKKTLLKLNSSKIRKKVKFPEVYTQYCRKNILVIENLEGQSLADIDYNQLSELQKKKIAKDIIQGLMRQILVEGEFHADPHPGNFIIMDSGELGWIDLGLTGRLEAQQKKGLSLILKASLKKDPNLLLDGLLCFTHKNDKIDKTKILLELRKVIKKHKKSVLGQLEGETGSTNSLEIFLKDLIKVAKKNGIELQKNTTLLLKALLTIEGIARDLDPKVNWKIALTPILLESTKKYWGESISKSFKKITEGFLKNAQ